VRAAALALVGLPLAGLAAEPLAVSAFSAQSPGAPLPAPWRELVPPRAKAPSFALVDDGGVTVLRVHSEAAAGTVAHALRVGSARRPMLAWRWKVDRVVEAADLAVKSGDDFAARVYVFFDVPAAELALGERIRLAIARLVYGEALPGAAICYVWDNRHPVGASSWNPYTDRVRTVVLESGPARAGQWVDERRDLVADYRSAFGARAPLHDISGIAAGNDTDQTRESATAWFGDFRIEPAGGAR
jgi:hypothetical protein